MADRAGRKWYDAARDPDNLADVPGVRVLSGRWSREWSDGEWPQWEELPSDRSWDFDSLAETQRRLPRIAEMFPRRQYPMDWGTAS